MAAGRLISRDGLGGLSMRVLAKEVGLTAPTLYGYFPSKEAVVAALAIERVAIMRDYLLRETADAEPGMPRLLALARAYRRLALTNADYYLMLIERSGPLASAIASVDADDEGISLLRALAEDVQAAVDQGDLAPVDPLQTILALWVAAHGYVSLELAACPPIMMRSEPEREDAYLEYVRAMLRGQEMAADVAATSTRGD